MKGRRRLFAILTLSVAVMVVAAACTGDDGGPRGRARAANTIAGLREAGAAKLSLLQAQSSLTTGSNLFTFGLVTANGGLLSGGSPQVYIGRDEASPFRGPYRATSLQFSAFERFHEEADHVTPLTSFYAVRVDIPSSGNWAVAALVEGSPGGIGTGSVPVTEADQALGAIGSKAISTTSPVATTTAKTRQICTRAPKPDPLHYISLDQALANGKPTVVTFATPALCESRICGPVVDEVWAVYEDVGKNQANFIHVEEFLPGPDLRPPPPTLENAAPAFRAWGLATEPWTFVIDADGIIQARFEGPVVAPQIEEALQPLL
jgi:hypothetical protein